MMCSVYEYKIYFTYTNIRANKQDINHFCLLNRTDQWQSLVGSPWYDHLESQRHMTAERNNKKLNLARSQIKEGLGCMDDRVFCNK